jgi:DNA polymerase III epsilon subunit family exonuclease
LSKGLLWGLVARAQATSLILQENSPASCHTYVTAAADDGSVPNRYAVVDVETTGFSPVNDRIVEVACVLVDGDRVVDRWATLVKPDIDIPARATEVHGITNEMVADAPGLKGVLGRLRDLCGSRTVVAHYARFDLSFLGELGAGSAICTLKLARALVPEAPNHKNQTLRLFLRIDDAVGKELGAHRALDDALVTAHILIACHRRFRQRTPGLSWQRFLRERASVP